MVVGEIARRHGDASALEAGLAMADAHVSVPRLAKVYDALGPDRSVARRSTTSKPRAQLVSWMFGDVTVLRSHQIDRPPRSVLK